MTRRPQLGVTVALLRPIGCSSTHPKSALPAEDRWNPQYADSLPPGVRSAITPFAKLGLIAIGLFAITGQTSLAFARGGVISALDPPLNPQHINGLPAEVRSALAHMCRGAQAQHRFAGYSQNLRTLVLHFEYLHCGDRNAFCTKAGCLHQVYVSDGGRYRLLRSYYAPEGD